MEKSPICVVRMPKSRFTINGMSTVGSMPRKFTATRQKTVAMRNCPISFAFGVSPSERSFTTFSPSSARPRAPASTVAMTRANVSGEGEPMSSTVTTTAISMISPPIVGVPCFTRWLSGPSARTCWPIWYERSARMNAGMRAIVITMESTTARNTTNVGYCENMLNISRPILQRPSRDQRNATPSRAPRPLARRVPSQLQAHPLRQQCGKHDLRACRPLRRPQR